VLFFVCLFDCLCEICRVGTLESQLSMDRLAKVIVDNKVDILSLRFLKFLEFVSCCSNSFSFTKNSFGEADYGDAGRFARALDNLILSKKTEIVDVLLLKDFPKITM
jgi:hypothetical protein